MNWRRNLVYLIAVALVIWISFGVVAGLSLGDCGTGNTRCYEIRTISLRVALGVGALALAYLIYRFIRDPRGHD